MPSHTATGKQKQRHRQAGVQVASRTLQNLDSFLIWESAGVAPCSRPCCIPQRGSEGQLVYAGGLRTRAFWSVNIIPRNTRRALLRIKLTFPSIVLEVK